MKIRILFLSLFLFSVSISSYGVELKKKLSGSATMAISDTDITVNLPSSVDMSQSFLLFSVRVSSADVEEVLIGGELASTTTLEFHRDGSGSEVNIAWQVLEFVSGMSVQRGTFFDVDGAETVTISSVNTGQSFATVSLRNNGNAFGSDDGVTIDINSATTIEIEANQNNVTAAYWQVVECADCSVQKIISTLSDGSSTQAETITSVNTAKTLLFSSQRLGGDIDGEDLPRTILTNSTTLTHTRSGNTNDINLITYVVEFSDATTVQHGSVSFAATELTNSAAITAVDESVSLVYNAGPLGYQGSSTNNTDDNPGSNWFTMDFGSDTSIDFERALDTYSGNITYQVAEFFYTAPTIWYTYGGGGNWSDPTTWTLNGSGLAYDNPSSQIPNALDQVVIMGSNGAAVTMDIDNVTVAGVDNSGELYVGTSSGHDFTAISGNGTIYLSGSGGFDNFPDGGIALFADTIVGGTVEYNGSGLTLDQARTFNNFILNLDNNTDQLVLLNDLAVNGDFTLTQGDFQINDNASTTILNLSVGKSALVDANASISMGQGDTRDPYTIGGTVPGTGSYHGIFHQVTFYGDFTNQGTVRFTNESAPVYNQFSTTGAATVIFTGEQNRTVSLFGVTDFYNLILDKGTDQTFELEINSDNSDNFALYGPNTLGSQTGSPFSQADPEIRKALWIYHGTLKFTGNINIPSLSEGGEDYIIGGNGALILDGTNVQIYSTATDASEVPGGSATGINAGSGVQAMTLQGKFQIDNGTFGTRNSAGFIFRDISSGEVIINGGTINVSQFRSSSSGAGEGKLSYTQTGGDVLVRNDITEAGELNGDYAVFSFSTTETVFTMTGGTLTTYGRTNGGSIFLNSDPGNYSITGGDVSVVIGDADEPVISSRMPFWNLTLDIDGGSATITNVDTETSGGQTILDPDLIVLNNLTIKSGVTLDHEGNDVEVGSDFIIENGGAYLYDAAKANTLTLNGIDNAIMGLYNIDGGGDPADQQVFYNLIIDKPHDKSITLESSKTGGNLTGWQNNLFRVNGDAFKVLSGTLDQGVHSILANCDTVVNYDVLTVFNPVDAGTDANPNSENDQLKFASNQGTPTDIVLITSDTAIIGNLKYYMQTNIVSLESDLSIQYLEYSNGRLDIQDHNLKIDYWDETKDFNGGTPSVNHMVVTNGSVSDGGLSLYIDSEKTYTYFFGIGLTGSEPTSKYTPASVTISNFTDDGYITIRPVDKVLATTDPTGDILSYYWKVDFSDFTPGSEPDVSYQFTYYDADLDGSTNEGLFVPGKVLEIDPFTRSSEVIGNMNTTNNLITFNGDTGGGTAPFTLEEASYTAGEPGRFVGAPTVFYSNVESGDWTQTATWALDRDGTTPAGAYPATGDIAIIQRIDNTTSPDNGTINIKTAVQAARVIFDDRHGFVNGTPKIIFNAQPNYASYGSDLKSVEVADTHEGGVIPSLSQGAVIQFNVNKNYAGEFPDGDFVDFNNYANAQVVYAWDGAGGSGDITLSSSGTEYPNLEISSVNSSGTIRFPDTTVTINGNFDVIEMEVIAAGGTDNYLTIDGDFNIGTSSAEGEFYFPGGSSTSTTVEVKGDLTLDGDNNKTNLGIDSPGSGAQTHRLIVHGDITIGLAGGNIDFGDGDLANTNVQLELTGEGIHESNNLYGTGITIDLYRIIMDKGSDINNSFTFNHDFTLTGSTNTATKAIELQNGLLALNDAALDLDLSTGGGDFNIPGTAGLQVTQGTVHVSGDEIGILLNGSLIVDGGNVDMDDAIGNGNNYIEYGAAGNASIEISGGSLTVGSQIRTNVAVPSGILTYTQTGGDVVVGKNAAPESSTGVFEVLNTGSSFTYTGGTLTLVRQNTASPGVAALRILPTFSDVSETIYIGNTDTPASQDNFGINSNISLAGLTISGTNSPTAVIMVNNLTLTDLLTIENGGTLDGNGIDLTLGGDLVNDGTYTPNGNATTFDAESMQSISGTGTTGFYDFYKTNGGTLNTSISFQVNNNFYLSDGIFDDNSNSIDLKGNVEIDGTHQSTGGAGEGLRLSGTTQQQLTRSEAGSSSLGIFTLQNSNGVFIPEGGGYNFTITNELKMNGGVFNIGSSEVTIGANATITTTGTYSVTNMVQTNSTFNDNGLVKVFPAGYTGTFLYPMGEANYTPVTVDCSVSGGTSGSTVGSIAVRPANEYHPTIDDGTDNVGGGAYDVDNVLQYYWTLRSSNMTGFSGDITFQYDQSDVSVTAPGYTEADYIPARILAFSNPTYLVNKYDASDVDETTNEILFSASSVFAGVDENGISGDYFCGIDDAIPNNVATYTVVLDGGSASDGSNTYSPAVPGGGAPSGAVVIIPNGFELIFDNNNVELYKTEIQDGATLTIENTKFHRLGILEGTGTLKIVHDDAGNPTLPLADYGTFFSCAGGSVEYAGTGSYTMSFQGQTSIRNLTLSGSGDRNFPNVNMTICEDLLIDGPNVITFLNNRYYIQGDFELLNGNFFLTSGSSSRLFMYGDLTISGGNFNSGNSGAFVVFSGTTYINGGTFNLGGSAFLSVFRGNLEMNGGALNSQTSNTYFNSNSLVQTISGDFTGTNSFYALIVDNRDGSQNFEFAGNVEITNALELDDGIINTNDNYIVLSPSATITPEGGQENSYINGRVVKTLSTVGDDFVFPIGGPTRYRPAYVQDVSVGGLDWEAEYYEASPTTDPDVSTLASSDAAILTMSTEEYWRITDGQSPGSASATVGISWGNDSYVSATSAEREQLRVMVWNDTDSNWDNAGGANYSGGHTEDFGMFNTTSAVSFSEKIFTLGSTDLSNPLPVELVSFTGQEKDGQVLLKWETASELNNDFFVIEHSVDGKTFTSISEVAGAGTVHTTQYYSYTHYSPVYPDNYYRLKQVDYDGAMEYSDIILVRMDRVHETEGIDFVMYPNPTSGNTVNLQLKAIDYSKPLAIEVVSLSGRLVYHEEIESIDFNSEISLDFGYGSAKGIYIVRLVQDGGSSVKKLVLK